MKSKLLLRISVGVLLAALAVPPVAQAQWTVFDPEEYALQVEKKVEEANRWVQTVNHYTQMYEKTVESVTRLSGILKDAEDLVAKQNNMIATMSDIGRAVRGVFLLKNQLEALVVTRIRAIKSIGDRARNGIFDPAADLQDFEEYLRDGIGRSSQDTVANMERLSQMDNQLERLYYDWQTAQARKAGAEQQKKVAEDNLQKELAQPEPLRCASCITDLKREISSCELLIAGLDTTISDLWTRIEQRTKKYNVVLQDQANFGQQVKTLDQGWTDFNGSKDSLSELLDRIEGRRIQSH